MGCEILKMNVMILIAFCPFIFGFFSQKLFSVLILSKGFEEFLIYLEFYQTLSQEFFSFALEMNLNRCASILDLIKLWSCFFFEFKSSHLINKCSFTRFQGLLSLEIFIPPAKLKVPFFFQHVQNLFDFHWFFVLIPPSYSLSQSILIFYRTFCIQSYDSSSLILMNQATYISTLRFSFAFLTF